MFGPTTSEALRKGGLSDAAITIKYLIGKLGSDSDHIEVATSATDPLLGVIQDTCTAAEQELAIQMDGISLVKAGGGITAGNPLTSDASGYAIEATAGQNIVGYALDDAVLNDVLPMLVLQQIISAASPSGSYYKSVITATFDPTTNAGERTIAKHGLGVSVPDNAIITRVDYEVLTTFTSANADGGTIALGIDTESEDGFVTAIAISDGTNPWDATVPVATKVTGATANYLAKTSAAREICATVAAEVLLGGKMLIFVEYYQSA